MTKCKGGCQMRAGGKTCKKCGCDMEDEEYEKGEKEEKEMRSGGSACMKCGGKMHKSGGTISSCMMCGGGKYTFGGKVNWSKKKVTEKYAVGGVVDTDWPKRKKKVQSSTSVEYEKLDERVPNMKNDGYMKEPSKRFYDEKIVPAEYYRLDNNPNILPGLKSLQNRYLDKSRNDNFQKYNNTTPGVVPIEEQQVPTAFSPFYLGPDNYSYGSKKTEGFGNLLYGLDEQNFTGSAGALNIPKMNNYISWDERNNYYKKGNIKSGALYSFGGVVKSLRKYEDGGEVGAAPSGKQDAAVAFMVKKDLARVKKASTKEELSSLRKEMESTYGVESAMFTATNRKLYEIDATDDQKKSVNAQLPLDDKPVVGDIFKYISGKTDKVDNNVINNAGTSTALILGNTPEKMSSKTSLEEDRSMPNWGRAKNEQQKLNKLILADRNAGKTNLEMLAEDDVIGDKTREAMAAYSGKGYARPELFSEDNLAQYKKNIAAGMKIEGSADKKETAPNPLKSISQASGMFDDAKSYILPNAGNDALLMNIPKIGMSKTGMFDDGKDFVKSNQNPKKPSMMTGDLQKHYGLLAEQGLKKLDEEKVNAGNDALLSNIPKPGQKIEPKKVNESNLQKLGFGKLNSKDVQVGDGDGVKINGVNYRIGDIDGLKAWFDAAETRYKGNKAQYKSGKSTYQNTAKQTLEELVGNTDSLYFKDTGKKTGDGRPIGLLYYGDKENPGLFHSSDSAMVKKGEAIYGMKKGSTEGQTERQKGISKDASLFEYHDSPSDARYKGSNLIDNSELGKPTIKKGSLELKSMSSYKVPKVVSEKLGLRKANGELYPVSEYKDSPYKTKSTYTKVMEDLKGKIKTSAAKEKTIAYENNRNAEAKKVDDINEKQELLRRAAVNQSQNKDLKKSSLKEGYLDMVGDDSDKYKRKKYIYDEVNKDMQKILSSKKYGHLSTEEKYAMLQRYYDSQRKNVKK